MTVTRDAILGWYFPATTAEFSELFAGTSIAIPDAGYLCQDAAGNLLDTFGAGAHTMGVTGSPHYQQTLATCSRFAIGFDDGDNDLFRTSLGADFSVTMFAAVSFPASVGGITRSIMTIGNGFGQQVACNTKPSSSPTLLENVDHGGIGGTDGTAATTGFHPLIVQANITGNSRIVQTDLETITSALVAGDHPNGLALGGDNVNYWFSAGMYVAYCLAWIGSPSEFDATSRATIISRIMTGIPVAPVATPLIPTFTSIAHAPSTKTAANGASFVSVANPSVGTVTAKTTAPPSPAQTASGLGAYSLPTSSRPMATDVATVSGRSLDQLQSGSSSFKWVLAIEGYPYLITDADVDKATVAWSGTDYVNALPGLYVELDSEQAIHPHDPFHNVGGHLTFRVHPDPTDQFGIDTHRASYGAEALLMGAANRLGTPFDGVRRVVAHGGPANTTVTLPRLAVDDGLNFVAGDVHVGTECVQADSVGGTFITTNVRGKYSPVGRGGLGKRFAEHHRVSQDINGVHLNPVVSQYPRVWVGRNVALYMHKVDGSGNLNSKSDALRVFVGQIASIADDPSSMCTVVECQHYLSTIKDTLIGRDMYSAKITEGISLVTGWVFSAADISDNVGRTANTLTVVASGAAGANQVNAGRYSLEEVCGILNQWLASELAAARLFGTYRWASPITSNVGLRTKCYWRINGATANATSWGLTMPREVACFLGVQESWVGQAPTSIWGGTTVIQVQGGVNTDQLFQGGFVPYRLVMFRNGGTVNNTANFTLDIAGDSGQIYDNYELLPAAISPPTNNGLPWAIFLLDEKYLVLGSYDALTNTISNCTPCAYQLPGVQLGSFSFAWFGRQADDTTSGPVSIRQVFIAETSFRNFVAMLYYSTGTPGYNHLQFDRLPYGFGIGIPGDLLGSYFETSLANLPGADFAFVAIIDQPTKLSELIGADLLLRRAFPIWRASGGADGCGGFGFGQWQTPNADVATLALAEGNKAAPAGDHQEHRTATVLSSEWMKNCIKVNYNRDITVDKDGTYQKTVIFEDQTSVDDTGGNPLVGTIDARNCFDQFAATGAGVEALLPGYLAMMPFFSKPIRTATRSLDSTKFEGYAPGDCALTTDAFMRDPATGVRGVSGRPAIVTRIKYTPGGPQAGNPAQVSPMGGEVEVAYLDLHRYGQYAPSARIDDTQANGGYDVASQSITCYPHDCSETGEAVDASRFASGDAVFIHEIDPASPASYLSWTNTLVAPPAGNVIALAKPLVNWSASKKYRITYDRYGQCPPTSTQLGKVFQAAVASGKIQGSALPYQWSSTPDGLPWALNAPTTPAELVPVAMYGDGRPFDVGSERALVALVNQLIDRKTAHCSPCIENNMQSAPAGTSFWIVRSISPIFLGFEQATATVSRTLTVRPWMRSSTGAAGQVRVTLSRQPPTTAPGQLLSTPVANLTVGFNDTYLQRTWTVGDLGTAWSAGYEQSFPCSIKDPNTGVAWLTIETFERGQCWGLAQVTESARNVTIVPNIDTHKAASP